MSIALGEKVLKLPYWQDMNGFPMRMRRPKLGHIIYVNYQHRYYVVQYDTNGLRESFIMRDHRRDASTIGGRNAYARRVREAVETGESAGTGGEVQGASPRESKGGAEA